MTQYTTRATIQERLRLAEQDEESPLLGGTVRLRELTRAAFKDAARWATTSDLADRERLRGALLAVAVQDALNDETLDASTLRRALGQYYLGAPDEASDADRWNAALLAASWIDPETGSPVVTREEILAWPARAELQREVLRLALAALDVSEVGGDHLKKESSPSSPATE